MKCVVCNGKGYTLEQVEERRPATRPEAKIAVHVTLEELRATCPHCKKGEEYQKKMWLECLERTRRR